MSKHARPALQDVDHQPAAKAAAKLEAEMADRDLAKLIVLTPSRKNGLDGKSGSHGHHVGSALTEGLRLFDEVSRVSGSTQEVACQSQVYVEYLLVANEGRGTAVAISWHLV